MASLVAPVFDAFSALTGNDPTLGTRIVVTMLTSFLIFIWWTWPNKLSKDTPGPGRNIPYFGATFELLANFDRLSDYSTEMGIKYGGRTWGGPMPRIGPLAGSIFGVNSPECVKYILKDNFNNYVKGDTVRECLGEFLGEGIFAADGAPWKFHRKVASHMFTARLLRESTAIAVKHSLRLLDTLRAKCETKSSAGAGVGSVVIDMQDMYFRLTMDIFTYIAFGVDLESVPRAEQHPFATAFDSVQLHSEKRFYNPLWKVARFFPFLSAGEREIARGTKVINTFASKVIAGKRRTLQGHAAAAKGGAADAGSKSSQLKELKLGPDLLSRFLEDAAKKEKADEESKKNGNSEYEARTSGTDKELRDIVLNFMIAGRDTTACALSWTLYELAKAPPEVSEKFRNEFELAFPSGTFAAMARGEELEGEEEDARNKEWYEKVCGMNFAHSVVTEVLRLHPSVPKDVKYAVNDDVLPDGTPIPAKSAVMYCPYAMGRDKSLWGEDALVFKPTRFLTGDGVKEPNMYTYPVFNAGPRLCLGKPLALMEIKLITGMLLQSFDFELPPEGHAGGYLSTLVLPMNPGIRVKLTPRRASGVGAQ